MEDTPDPSIVPPLNIIIGSAEFKERYDTIALAENIGYLALPFVPYPGPADAEATHHGAVGSMHEPQRAYLHTEMAKPENADLAADVYWLRVENRTGPDFGKCLASHDGLRIGDVVSLTTALAELGLQHQVIEE